MPDRAHKGSQVTAAPAEPQVVESCLLPCTLPYGYIHTSTFPSTARPAGKALQPLLPAWQVDSLVSSLRMLGRPSVAHHTGQLRWWVPGVMGRPSSP